MNLLILGGTTEATALARALAGDARFSATLSLAGVTRWPAAQPIPIRVGGFGGVAGLAQYLREHRIGALLDATHPFATQMTANAIAAARQTDTPLLVVLRPAWQPTTGDHWTMVESMDAAAATLGTQPRRVLLTVGRKDLAPFRAAPWHHYVLRSVDPPPAEALPPHVTVIAARGPFALADEEHLLRDERIEIVVTKNSGGSATAAKLTAARNLGLPVVMLGRPPLPQTDTVGSVGEVLAWLEQRHVTSPRGE
jgi:precorrin-6A/cobalt-precorrin-6A reductase